MSRSGACLKGHRGRHLGSKLMPEPSEARRVFDDEERETQLTLEWNRHGAREIRIQRASRDYDGFRQLVEFT